MTDPLTTLEGDLTTLAAADTADPQNGTATAQPALTAAQQVLSLLADQTLVGPAIGTAVSGVYSGIATAITDDVVKALQLIAGELTTTLAGLNVANAASALSSLQNVLQTAQSLVPGGSSAVASAFASTSQFATLFGNLLADAGSVTAAANTLYEIAQQLEAVAAAFATASQGNPSA
jgi:hypothetical protein